MLVEEELLRAGKIKAKNITFLGQGTNSGGSAKDRRGSTQVSEALNQMFITEQVKSARGEPGWSRALTVKGYPEVGKSGCAS